MQQSPTNSRPATSVRSIAAGRRLALRSSSRRGSTYLLVVSVAVIVSTISIGALAISQTNRRMSQLEEDYDRAGILAESAIEQFFAQVAYDTDWRNTHSMYQGGVYSPDQTLHDGTADWQLIDPIDNDITDEAADAVLVYGRGRSGDSQRVFSLIAFQKGAPMDVLRTAVHGTSTVSILDATICARGPVSSNSEVKVSGAHLYGDVESPMLDDANNVTGSTFVPAPVKSMPSAKLFDVYRRFAGTIDFDSLTNTGKIKNELVSPNHNPTSNSDRNKNGVYRIAVPVGEKLVIEQSRIEGTLLVELTGANSQLEIGDGVIWKSYRSDFPALLVYTANDTNTVVTINCAGNASESTAGVNFNPSNARWFKSADSDTNDTYPATLRGVFHIIRDVTTPQSKTVINAENAIVGCVIADGMVDIAGFSRLQAATDLMSVPLLGYTTAGDPANVIYNSAMETQIAPWLGIGATANGGVTKLEQVFLSGNGTPCIEIGNRSSGASGIAQDLTERLQSGRTYSGSVRLKMNDQDETAIVSLVIDSEGEGLQRLTSTASATTSWNQHSFSFAPVWTGDLKSARFIVTTAATNQNFRIDDATILDPRTRIPSNLVAIPSTWQAEAVSN